MHLVYANRRLLYRTTARSLVATAGAAPCCCGLVGGCVCEAVPLVGCQSVEVPDSCCNWGQSRRQTLALTFTINYDKPSTPNNPFTCQSVLIGDIDAVRIVTCANGQETVTYEVTNFSIGGTASTSSGRIVAVSYNRENFPPQYGTFEAWLEGMFLRVGETCYTGATNRLLSFASLARAMLIERIEPTADLYAVPDPTANGWFYATNERACGVEWGSVCNCPGSFSYTASPIQASFGVFGWKENPSYNWTGTCLCRRTIYTAQNQYDLQDSGVRNFAGRISINGAYTHVVSDVVECVPNPCEQPRPLGLREAFGIILGGGG